MKPFKIKWPGAILRITLFFSLILLSVACSSKKTRVPSKADSPLGLYQSNTPQQFWLAILADNSYLLCSIRYCRQGQYESIAARYGVILLDFFSSDIGLKIERLSHGQGHSEVFYQQMRQIRLRQMRPNDLAFHVSDCGEIFCAGIGHRAEGVKFFKVVDFNQHKQVDQRTMTPIAD